jgi:hypothetical protein
MKNVEIICRRAVILLSFCDRCSIEDSYASGTYHSLEEREEQREAIKAWLIRNGYYEYATPKEKEIFETQIEEERNEEIYQHEFEYEALEPILWTLGLLRNTSKFDDFVIKDFHPTLQIGRNHTFENLLKSCSIRKHDEIIEKREIAMLWHWRSIEGSSHIFKEKDAKEVILSVFGSDYRKYLRKINFSKWNIKDFLVNSRPFNQLSDDEIYKVQTISYWRQYAFEWITGDTEWDETEVNT